MKYHVSIKKNSTIGGSFVVFGICCLVLMTTIFLSQGVAQAADVTLAWDTSDGAAGYKIYYGTMSNSYTDVVDVGDVLTYTFPDLSDGVTYFFAATAYDDTNLESDFSEEVSYNTTSETKIIWRNPTTGENYVWYMDGTTRTSSVKLTTVPSPWEIVGTGDFNSDNKTDILWRNPTTGENYVWYMDGATRTSSVRFSIVTPPWEIVGQY